MIEPPQCWQYKPGDFLPGRLLNWHEIIDHNDDDENWADPGMATSRRSRPGKGNDNVDGECEEGTHCGEQGTEKGKGTMDGKWQGMRKGKATENTKGKGQGNRERIGIAKQSPGGDDISRAVALLLQKGMYKADSNTVC